MCWILSYWPDGRANLLIEQESQNEQQVLNLLCNIPKAGWGIMNSCHGRHCEAFTRLLHAHTHTHMVVKLSGLTSSVDVTIIVVLMTVPKLETSGRVCVWNSLVGTISSYLTGDQISDSCRDIWLVSWGKLFLPQKCSFYFNTKSAERFPFSCWG